MQYITDKIYLKQNSDLGVNIFPYKVAAGAPFDCHFVIDASQKSATVTVSALSFVSKDRRTALNITDSDISDIYIKMYEQNNSSNFGAFFTSSKNTFDGFSIPHSFLTVIDTTKPEDLEKVSVQLKIWEDEDFITQEKQYFISNGISFPKEITSLQKESFEKWKNFSYAKTDVSEDFSAIAMSEEIKTKIKDYCFRKQEEKNNDGKLSISSTSLSDFFNCPKYWFLNRIAKVETESLEAELTSNVNFGINIHAIMEKFFKTIKENNEKIVPYNSDFGKYDSLLINCINEVLDNVNESFLTKELLKTMKDSIYTNVKEALEYFTNLFIDFTVVGTEDVFSVSQNDKEWFYYGKIDLVLCNDECDVFLIDFKTGGTPKAKECIADEEDNLANFQFAMYTKLWEENHNNQKLTGCGFYSINKNKYECVYGLPPTMKVKDKPIERDDFDNTLKVLTNYTDTYFQAVKTGELNNIVSVSSEACVD